MRYYIDSSVLIAILFQENLSRKYLPLLKKAGELFSSHLLEAEVYSTAARESLKFEDVSEMIESVSLVIPDRSLKEEYQQIFAEGYCRGADSLHLATALYLDPKAKHITFLSADTKQKSLAKKLGFQTI